MRAVFFRSLVAMSVTAAFAALPVAAQQTTTQPSPKADSARPADATANVRSDTGAHTTIPGGAVTGAGQAQMDRQTAKETGTARPLGDQRTAWERTHRASRIIGTNVFNRQGERLGDIKDIVLDPQQGSVSYAVVSFGGFLGIGERLFAVPWKALEIDASRNAYVMDGTREKLRQAAGFDPNNWPNMTDPKWNADTHGFFGQQWRGGAAAPGATGATR